MDTTSIQILLVLEFLVKPIQVGTNLALLQLMWSILNGSFLRSRGAVHSALALNHFDRQTIQRCWSTLRRGVWSIEELNRRWCLWVAQETTWQAHTHGGFRPVSFDLTTFWRPKLTNWLPRGFHRLAGRLLPGAVFGISVKVGEIEGQRLPLLHKLLRSSETAGDEADLKSSLLAYAAKQLDGTEVALFDGGFELKAIQTAAVSRFVVRLASNCVMRRNSLPDQSGKRRGRRREYGDAVRPLARSYRGKLTEATPADKSSTFEVDGVPIRADGWFHLLRRDEKVAEQLATVTVWAFHDSQYATPLLLATSLEAPASVIFKLYLDRWPVEQVPLVAKQMLGLQRMFVHASASVWRLPEIAMLMGNVLTIMASTLPPIPSGYWDRRPKKRAVVCAAPCSGLNFAI